MNGTDVPRTLYRERNPQTAERFLTGSGRYSPASRRAKGSKLISLLRMPCVKG